MQLHVIATPREARGRRLQVQVAGSQGRKRQPWPVRHGEALSRPSVSTCVCVGGYDTLAAGTTSRVTSRSQQPSESPGEWDEVAYA